MAVFSGLISKLSEFSPIASRLSVEVGRGAKEYLPGETVSGKVKLKSLREVNVREVLVSLKCIEWVKPRNGEGGREAKEVVLWNVKKKLGGGQGYRGGEWSFRFAIPKDALPSIIPEPSGIRPSGGAGIRWLLHAKMDVSASIDLHAYEDIFLY